MRRRERANPMLSPRRLRRALTRRIGLKLAFGWIGVVVLCALFAPTLVSQDPDFQDLAAVMEGPSGEHWLGTDDLGRDVFTRLLVGARTSVIGVGVAMAVALGIGIPIGLISGYLGGWVDNLTMRVIDAFLSFPALVLAVGIVGALGRGLMNAMVAVGIIFAPTIARLLRGQVLATKHRLYIDAARQYGSGTPRIIVRHLLPNAIQPVVVQGAILVAMAFLAEAGLSFLGLGVQPPTASWGGMLNRASRFLRVAPASQIYAPGLAIMLTALAFNVIGDALRDLLDPRARRRASTPPETT